MTKLTDTQFAEALQAVAAERPWHVYVKQTGGGPNDEGCVYHRSGDLLGCLIGETLAALGVDQDTLAAKSGDAYGVLPDFGLSDRCAEAATSAQMMQDTGIAWGACAEAFASAYDNWEPRDPE